MLPQPFIPAKPRVRRKRRQAAPAAPAALVLVAAAYDFGGPSLTLTFDRPIDVAGLAGPQIVVDDHANTAQQWIGAAAVVVLGPTSVRIDLIFNGDIAGDFDVLLTAGAGNGIVAEDDGAAWAGVANLQLPFP